MAVSRQLSISGGQRVDVPLLRSLESAICNDFDVLAGRIIGGKTPLVVSGLRLISTGVTNASALQLEVADALVIHFLASESGSIFSVPSDRAPELLNGTNPRIVGSFSPGATNYVGLDFTRITDDSTADLQMFLDATLERETPKTVPLARTIDYRIVISTRDFSSTPGICPIAKVVTTAGNGLSAGSVVDARNLLGRLGSGGATPDAQSSYSWPSGRKESFLDDPFAGGDKSISSLKSWMDATMTRIWEMGGGEQWYSPTSDRNLRLVHVGSPFVANGEFFQWDGTDAHWQGLRVVFDNSTGWANEIADQTVNLLDLTNLVEGDCLYVDLDRSQDRTTALGNALQAQRGKLTTLGTGDPPGSRLVFAWLVDGPPSGTSYLVTRDHVGGTFRAATSTVSGIVKTTADILDPRVPVMTGAIAICGGISRRTDIPGNTLGAGNIYVGSGALLGDHNVVISSDDGAHTTIVQGKGSWTSNGIAALEVRSTAFREDGKNRSFVTKGYDTATSVPVTNALRIGFFVESDGATGHAPVTTHPGKPVPTASDPARAKRFFRPSRWWRADCRVALLNNIAFTYYGAGVGKTMTYNGALTIDGVLLNVNDRVLVMSPDFTSHNGIYKLTQQGGASWVLTRAVDADDSIEVLSGMATKVTEGTTWNNTFWMLNATTPVVVDTTNQGFVPISGRQTTDQDCVMWHDGSITVIAESPPYNGTAPAAP